MSLTGLKGEKTPVDWNLEPAISLSLSLSEMEVMVFVQVKMMPTRVCCRKHLIHAWNGLHHTCTGGIDLFCTELETNQQLRDKKESS